MMVWSINLIVLSVFFLLIGIFAPQWLMFWLEREKPPRSPIFVLSMLLFMAGAMMFAEANLEKQQLSAEQEAKTAKEAKADSLPTISPEVVKPADKVPAS